jgi:predicted enzyme related to lactoylglutathione lyase
MTTTAAAVRSAITWFEIPTADFDRARRFYESILEAPLRTERFENARIAIFPHEGAGIGGCLDEGSHSSPSMGGTVVYLDVDGRLDATLARVESAGGRILKPKTALPPGMGSVAHIVDSEGNLIGLHALS